MKNKQKVILVVDDEKPMAHALEIKLTKAGFLVELAEDGDEAVSKLEKQNYDLTIMDIMMPKLNGFGVLERMKEKGIKSPVFMMSNLGQNEDISKAKGLGASEYFVKSDTPIGTIVDRVKSFCTA